MNDPNKQPGYGFAGLRLVDASYKLVLQPDPQHPLTIDIDFSDRLIQLLPAIVIRQRMEISFFDSDDNKKVRVRMHVELEGVFQPVGEVNISPADFANNHAPTILFPFVREWIHRLTTETGAIPPVLLPPINVLNMRKARETQIVKPEKKASRSRRSKK